MKHIDFELIILGQELFLAGQRLEHLQVNENSNKNQTQHQQIKKIYTSAVRHLPWGFQHYQLEISRNAKARTPNSALAVAHAGGGRPLTGWPWQVVRQELIHEVCSQAAEAGALSGQKFTDSLMRGGSLSQLKLALPPFFFFFFEVAFITLKR